MSLLVTQSESLSDLVEKQYYRDQLRRARYSALADAEGFHSICFVIEELGIRLCKRRSSLNQYEQKIQGLVTTQAANLAADHPDLFSTFSALYRVVRAGRNDAMHTGSYARHITSRAIELCILLEDCLMATEQVFESLIGDFMVREPLSIDKARPVAKARQMMLTHSFSNLPVKNGNGKWCLISDIALAKYLAMPSEERDLRLGTDIGRAISSGNLAVNECKTWTVNNKVRELFEVDLATAPSSLWLVVDSTNELVGVISPFEVM
jgi:CBS domain-containing protein